MSNMKTNLIEMKCDKCGNKYKISEHNIKRRIRNNTPNLCAVCMNIYSHDMSRKSKEELYEISKKISNSKKEYWKSDKNREMLSNKMKSYWNNLSEDDKNKISIREKDEWNNLSEEEKKSKSKYLASINKEWRSKLSEEEKIKWKNSIASSWNTDKRTKQSKVKTKLWIDKDNNEKQLILSRINNGYEKWYKTLSENEKEKRRKNISIKSTRYWKSMDSDIKANRMISLSKASLMKSYGANKLHIRFENQFNNSEYELIPEKFINGHYWDYAIYKNNILICIVDLDGEYFHATDIDYDGIHSKLEYDLRRRYSIPDKILHFYIREKYFDIDMKWLFTHINNSYEEYCDFIFTTFRMKCIPYPYYADSILLKSYDKLQRMDCDDKYHTLDINSRLGDLIIHHFHQSLWEKVIPIWNDDNKLKNLISSNIIDKTYLDMNKVFLSFIDTQLVPNILSPSIIKMIINKYINNCKCIYDPNCKYGEIILGAISYNKKIKFHSNDEFLIENNNMMNFLSEYKIKFNIDNNFDCIFTNVINDDEINYFMNKYKCEKYLFIAESTNKYSSYIKETFKFKYNVNDKLLIIL